jgi:outer membrane protein assembly factor BamA
VETSVSASRIGTSLEVLRAYVDPIGNVVGNERFKEPGPPPLHFGQASVALVGDWSNAAFTSPVAGGRYRFEIQPTFGQITFNTALADYRRYFFMRPFTFAWRGIHYGRYGQDAESFQTPSAQLRIPPLFLGEEQLVRGYAYGSFDPAECVASEDPDAGRQGSCPVIERLLGSRMAVLNAEFRIPLIGTREFGLLNIPFLPVEISPFFDAGLMWTSDQAPALKFKQEAADETPTSCFGRSICAERIPVFSTGISARINVLGYMIFETYFAKPFQRPTKGWVWGFQLAPGW